MLPLENMDIARRPWLRTVFDARIKQIKIYLNEVGTRVSGGDQAIRFSDSRADDREVQEAKGNVSRYSQIVKGMQELQYAKECLEAKGDPVDLSWLAIDHLIEAMKLTKKLHTKTYCQARLMEGEIFLSTVNNKVKAIACFDVVVKNYKTAEECVDAKFHLDRLRTQMERENNNTKSTPRQDTTSSEYSKLEEAIGMSDEDFASFVFTQLPPKHKSNCKMPVLQDKKKAFFRLASFYHPDKVDQTVWGAEYKMLCEEISKRFNSRYASMK